MKDHKETSSPAVNPSATSSTTQTNTEKIKVVSTPRSRKNLEMNGGRPKRAMSASQIDRNLNNKEIFTIGNELLVQPHYIKPGTAKPLQLQLHRNRKKYLCAFPGCGEVFTTWETGEMHSRSHASKTHLATNNATVPQADQYMRFYWPRPIIWKSKKIVRKVKGFGKWVCPVPDCNRNFIVKELLYTHMVSGHSKFDVAKLNLPSPWHVEWHGEPRVCPPFYPPPRAEIPLCHNSSHLYPKFRCKGCRENSNYPNGPKQPVRFFDKGTYFLTADKKGPKISFSFADPESCVIVYDESVQADVPVHIAGACTDRFKKPYLSIAKYYNATQMKKKHGFKTLPIGFDKANELIQEIDCHWVELSEIVNYCYVLCVDRDEYKRRGVEGSLPKHDNVKFSQYIYSPDKGEITHKRSIIGNLFEVPQMIELSKKDKRKLYK